MNSMLRPRWLFLPVGLALLAAAFALSGGNAAAQSADSDGDGYADELEEELGSNFAHPDSTPEHFALLWTCTDGNDNDKDGTRDFIDPGCRNTPPGATPTPAPTPPPGGGSASGGGGGSSGGGSTGGGSGSGSGGTTGGASGSPGENAVLGGSGGAVGGGSSGSGGSGPDSASDTTAGTDAAQGSGDTAGATDALAGDTGAADGAGADSAASESTGDGDGGGFPWMLSLLILFGGLALAAIAYAVAARKKVRSGHPGPASRY